MRPRTWILASLLVTAPSLVGLTEPRPARAQASQNAPPGPCEPDPVRRQTCLAGKASQGRYQEIIDEIETSEIGRAPYEKYFLGISYFGLSGRTGAASLRCFWTAQARSHLESFLENRKEMMASLNGLGNADELKYTYVAARVLESAREVAGCDESGEPLSALERHARDYLSRAVEDLFFYYGSPGGNVTPARGAFDAQMSTLQEVIQGFVAAVSRMETNYALTQVEIDVAKRDLAAIVALLNQWRADSAVETADEARGVPKITYGPGFDRLLREIDAKTEELTLLAGQGGEIGEAKAVIDRFIAESGASDMKDYQAQRARTVAAAQRLQVSFATLANDAQAIARAPAFEQLKAPPPSEPEGIEARWSAIAQQWRSVKPACNVFPNKWYCR